MVRVFANGPGDLGSIPGRVIRKTKKMLLGVTLLNTQQYKVRVKWSNLEKGVAPSPTNGVVAIEKGAFWLPSISVANFTFYTFSSCRSKPFSYHQKIINQKERSI